MKHAVVLDIGLRGRGAIVFGMKCRKIANIVYYILI